MRIAGSALHVSFLAAAGVASLTLIGCASSPKEPTEPQIQDDAAAAPRTRLDAAALERAGGNFTVGQEGQSARDAELLSLREQKDRLLFDAAMERARELKQTLQLEEALAQVERALAINADNLEAKRLRAELAVLLDRPDASAGVGAAEADRYRLKLEQLRLGVKQDLNDAKLALGRGDYAGAVAELRLARTKIEVGGYDVDWQGVDEEVMTLLAQAEDERAAAEEAARLAEREEAFSVLQEKQRAEQEREQLIVDNIVASAALAFEESRYGDAEEFARLALQKQPRNDQAEEIRTASFRASRQQVQSNYLVKKAEEFRRWREGIEELRIPRNEIITLPDADEWRRKSELRSRRVFNPERNISPIEAELRTALSTTPVTLPSIEDEESLKTVMGYVRDFTNLPIIVDQAAEDLVSDEGIVYKFNFENALTAEQAINRIVAVSGEEIRWTIKYDAIFVTTTEKAVGAPIPVVHDVQDLIFGLTDFSGPRIDRIRLIDELEDDDGGGPFGFVGEPTRIIELENLQTLIQDTVAPETWERDGVGIEVGETNLLVTQTPEVQAEIRDFLEDLRKFNSELVTIESKFLEVTDNFIQEIGNDFRGLDDRVLEDVTNGLEDMASLGLDNGGSGTDGTNAAGAPSAGYFFDDGLDGTFAATTQNFFETALGSQLSTIGGLTFQMAFFDDSEVSAILRAVEKSEKSEVVNSQMLSVHDSQRAYVTVINQRAYIQDFDVEVAQFQAVADPVINVLNEGIVLDVRPTILENRKWLRLEIQPTVARVVALRDFSTTLGGNTAPVEFQLPELEVQSVNTSAFLPDGGSLLLGGLSRIRNVERRAEVPWIGRVPLLGFLFKQEGYNDEKNSLMILVKATITDIRESVENKLEAQY
ncbi:MAG: hypothetical protein AAF957_18320 [Planctomycetota bacterium]